MDNNHAYQNTEKMEIDDIPMFPIERPDGYYEGWFSKSLQYSESGQPRGLVRLTLISFRLSNKKTLKESWNLM